MPEEKEMKTDGALTVTPTVMPPVINVPLERMTFAQLDAAIKDGLREFAIVEANEQTWQQKKEQRKQSVLPFMLQMRDNLKNPGKRTDINPAGITWTKYIDQMAKELESSRRSIQRLLAGTEPTTPSKFLPQPGTPVVYGDEIAVVTTVHEPTKKSEAPKVDLTFVNDEANTEKAVYTSRVTKAKKVKLSFDVIYLDDQSGRLFTYSGEGKLHLIDVKVPEQPKKVKTPAVKKTTATAAKKTTRRKVAPAISLVSPTKNIVVAVCTDDKTKLGIFADTDKKRTTTSSSVYNGTFARTANAADAQAKRDEIQAKYTAPAVAEPMLTEAV